MLGRKLSVMPGEVYGKLTVTLGRRGPRVICLCECGELYAALPRNLRDGSVRACTRCRGDRKTKWGHKYGPLEVGDWIGGLQAVEKAMPQTPDGRQVWVFKCVCGGERVATASEMKRYVLPSCGTCRENGVVLVNSDLDHYRFLFNSYYNMAINKDWKFYDTRTSPPELIYDPEKGDKDEQN